MRIFRLLITVIFVLTSTAFIWFYVNETKNSDKTFPQISVDTEELEIKVGTDEIKLLEGVTAFDAKDGDLTDKIIVESVSQFIKPGVSVVSYSVCDSDNHVSSVKRTVRYSDYKPPRFSMKAPLLFSTTDNIAITNALRVEDMFDGDISSEIIVKSEEFDSGTEGTYKISAQVSNSKGDTIVIDLPVVVEKEQAGAPQIKLKKYLVYAKKGEAVDPNSYVDSVKSFNGETINTKITTKTDYKKDVPGTYYINYYAADAAGVTGHTILTVIVEG